MFVQFEDLINNYSETIRNIEGFLGFSEKEHIKQRQIFNPLESIKNTQLYKRYPECNEEIRYIEGELKEYLYEWR